jgi:hypothetical protein
MVASGLCLGNDGEELQRTGSGDFAVYC